MSSREDMIGSIDEQLGDIAEAKMAAAQQGKGIGDYDLSMLAQAARKDRIAAQNAQIMKDAFNAQAATDIYAPLNKTIEQNQAKVVQGQKAAVEKDILKQSFDEARRPQNSTMLARFRVGANDYTIIDKDDDKTRKMIVYDANGNVDPNSPVIPIGVNPNGGFILAARFDSQFKKLNIPVTTVDGASTINYPQSRREPGIMDRLTRSGAVDTASIIDPDAAGQIRKLYY